MNRAGSSATRSLSLLEAEAHVVVSSPTQREPATTRKWDNVVEMLGLGMSATGRPQLILQPISPMAYLDHWALSTFSRDPELGRRLTQSLHDRGGTLALSWMNFAEYSTVADAEQRRQTERFLDGILPSVYCLESDPFPVAERERSGHELPHADRALAATFINPQQPRVVTASGLINRLFDNGLASRTAALAATVQGRLEDLRQTFSDDADFRRVVKHTAADNSGPAVLAVLRALVETLMQDTTRVITANDAIDFLHTVVPVVYCDVVVLDGGWEDRVERARRKLSRVEPPVRMAAAFSARRDGIQRFLAHLTGNGSPPTLPTP